MNNNDKHDFIDTLFIIIIFLAVIWGVLDILTDELVEMLVFLWNNPIIIIALLSIALFTVVVNRKDIAVYIKNTRIKKKNAEYEKEMETLEKSLATARKLRFENAPSHLTNNQMNALNYFLKTLDIEANKNSVIITRPEFTNEELYTIIFINKESFEVIGQSVSGKTVTLEVRRNNGKAEVLNKDDLSILKPTAIIEPVKKSHKQTKKINALRKERKLKAEAKANGLVYKNGKLYQPPNYTFLANEWVSQNIGLINKIIIDNDTPTSLVITGLILADSLPDDKNTWKHIGQNLIDTDNIDRFAVQKNGLQIIINK